MASSEFWDAVDGQRQNEFAAAFETERTHFYRQRAQRASAELLHNRLALDDTLTQLREISSLDVEADGAIDHEYPPESTSRGRASRRRRSEVTSAQLEPGKLIGVKLNVKASPAPRFRKSLSIPIGPSIPTYTSWNFVSANQQQQKVYNKKRLFYTDDDTGETLPASDDEMDRGKSHSAKWEMKDWEWREFSFEAMLQRFGTCDEFASLLAACLGVDVALVEERLRKQRTVKASLDTTRQLCRRCLRYNCSLHPESNVIPVEQPVACSEMPYMRCGDDCWVTQDTVREAEAVTADLRGEPQPEEIPWDPDDVDLLEKGIDIYGENPCALRRFVWTKTCFEIHQYLRRHPDLGSHRLAAIPRRRKVSRKMSVSCRKGAPVVAKRLRHSETELWHQYLPCTCKTSCSSTCPCVKSKNFCDKYCACWNGHKSVKKLCGNAWKGCKCSQRCDTQRCPCVAASRECDPDLCVPCRSGGTTQCRNMNIRTRRNKRVAMGLSEIVGWGTFMLESVKKDELIGEYTGELISDDEAERRGRIYDIEDKSYLFSATSETVIDANHRGNKLRFANHSSEPNCYVKYLLVDGDYRVGIFAGRDIRAGEELLYDYGGAFSSHWNEERRG